MHSGAAIEPDANFVLAGGFELGDPPFFFVRHGLPECAATLAEGISERTYATATGSTAFVAKHVSEAKRLRTLEEENRKLKKLLAESMLDNAALKELLSKKW